MFKDSVIPEQEAIRFPVIGIGITGNDLELVRTFIRSVHAGSGMAYILFQIPAQKDNPVTPAALAGDSAIPVQQLTDTVGLEADHIFLMPPGKTLAATEDTLKLIDFAEEPDSKPLNLFYAAIGTAFQNFTVGIITPGAVGDGMQGLRVIKASGGITIAIGNPERDASLAQLSTRTGTIDFVLPPEGMPVKLLEINRPFHTTESDAVLDTQMAYADEDILRQILTLLRLKKNVDFTNYKQTTIKRRIIRRMALNKISDPAAYLAYLRNNKGEQDKLYSDMLISVTGFFRDPKSFDLLCSKVMPDLIRRKKANDPLRIWVAGCATGEEAYSIAMCLSDYLHSHAPNLNLQIFATDISEKAINKARRGIYEKAEMDGLNPGQIEKFFVKSDGFYQVKKSIREYCVFALHNLLKDPPFARMDLITCRNVLIYMDAVLQKKAFRTFHYALNEHGVLMLGKSETPGMHAAALFNRINNHEKIYSKKSGTSRPSHMALSHSESVFVQPNKTDQAGKDVADFQKTADELILARFAPPGVVVNEQFDIVQFRGSTGAWLEPSPGKASFNLLKMAKEGLSFELRNVLHKARQTNGPVRKEHILMVSNDEQKLVTIEAMPLANTNEPYYLVLFQPVPAEAGEATQKKSAKSQQAKNSLRDLRIEQLEKELALAREDMRSITEEQEAANEELQSANEELLSSSEELRSLNEELENSQEELQSNNEELSMLNHELVDRNNQLTNARFYAEAILDTVKDPLLILDNELRVRTVTQGFFEKFKTTEQETEGHYFYELRSCPWDSPELMRQLEQVLSFGQPLSGFELTCNFPAIGTRNILINARVLDRINDEQLIIVSVEDVTYIRQEQEELRSSKRLLEERIRLAVEATGMATWDFDPVAGVIQVDERCRQLFGFGPDEEINYNSFQSAIHPKDREFRERTLQNALRGDNGGAYDIEYRICAHNEFRWVKSKGRAFFTKTGEPYRLVGTMLDITSQRLSEELLLESEQRFRHAADAAPLMMWMSGPDSRTSYFNKSWLQFTGRSMEQELDRGWGSNIHPEDQERCLAIYHNSFADRADFYMEYRLHRQDGIYRWVADTGAPRFSPNGTFEGYIGICTDIHEQRRTRDELERLVAERTQSLRSAVNELEASNQNLEEFAYVASHDLQEPLRKIQTFASFLQQGSQNEQLGKDTRLYLSKIKDAANRMGQLIDDILSYSRLKNADQAFMATDLNQVLQQVVSTLDMKIVEQNATIDIAPLPLVRAVPTRMNQLFQNLISNALKFSKATVAPLITITAAVLDETEQAAYTSLDPAFRYTCIQIRDNGIGFDQEFAERIFVIFQRLNGRSEYEGTGIGLAICRKIVMNHHGIITASGKKDEGATFRIILPLAAT